jgi:chaperonin GroES
MDQGLGTMMGDPSQPMENMGGMAPMGGDPSQNMQAMAAQAEPPAPGMPMEMGQTSEPQVDESKKYIDWALSQMNLAKFIKKKKGGEDKLNKIGEEVVRGYNEDEQSRADWMKNTKEWLKLALLVRENKTFPWVKASNVKYPLIATAAMQFSARAYPSLVPSNGQLVSASLPQNHPNKALVQASRRVSNHMSFQIRYTMDRWEEDMDKLLMSVAICGTVFKKTYYDPLEKQNKSDLLYPEKLVVNYYAKSLDKAYRKTEIMEFTENELRARMANDEEFLDILEDLSPSLDAGKEKEQLISKASAPSEDGSTPYVFLSQHTFFDLDDDGYEEPYVVTVHRDTGKVVRIIARYDLDGVTTNAEGDIIHIRPVEYFTDYTFIPNPDGSIYGLGFGQLLGPLNVSINTLINQLVDAGTINNLQSGFIGKGLRIKMGETGFKPGEWKVVNATGDDLSKSVFPLPSKEPSPVLFNLMNLLIQSGNQLASIAEIFVGKMPGQNTPATTTQETVQQSMAVFTAIYKRIYRALTSEFRKLHRLNRMNPENKEQESKLAGMELMASDYDYPEWMIMPGADPSADSFAMRAQKMQSIGQLLQLGTINPQVYTQKMLEMLELPDVDEWMQQPPPPPPDPKAQAMQMKGQLDQQKAQSDMAAKEQEMKLKERMAELEHQLKLLDLRVKEREAELKQADMQHKMEADRVGRIQDLHATQVERQMNMMHAAASNQQKLQQGDEAFKQKQQQSKESQKSKPKK